MERHQQIRGQKLPEGVRSVARPSRWGNPWKVGPDLCLDEALWEYGEMVDAMPTEERDEWLMPLLEAKGIACYCRLDQKCHGDLLLVLIEELRAGIELMQEIEGFGVV